MALLTAPFDSGATRGGFGDATQIASLFLRQHQTAQAQLDETAREMARAEEAKQRAQQAVLDGAVTELRRAAEFKQKRAFEDAQLAARTMDSTRDFGLKDREMKMREAENAPFQLSPSASIPAPAGTAAPDGGPFGVSASPSPGMSFGTGWNTASGSVFGMVPDGKGGLMHDPNDKTDAGVPGFSATKGAWGAPIKDPALKGVALRPDELRAAGVPLNDPSAFEVEVNKDGKTFRYPIVDKLGKAGRIDFTAAAYNELGGPTNRGGGLIQGINYKIVPKGAEPSPAARMIADTRSQIEGMQAMGIPVTTKDARALALSNARTTERAAMKTSTQPVKVNLQDESGNLYTQFRDGSWKDGREPEPGSKMFTIGAPGRPSIASLEWHADGTVTSKTGKVFHYNDKGDLEPAYVPKGKSVKYTLQDNEGEVHTQFTDGSWDTEDGLPPQSAGLTRMSGATEEKRLELRTEAQKIAEKQRAASALRSDRDHFEILAMKEQREADKFAADLAKNPVVWPWQQGGQWYRTIKGVKSEISEAEANKLIAESRQKETTLAGHSTKIAEYTKRSEEADKKLESFMQGIGAPEAPEAAPAPASPPPVPKQGKPLDRDTAMKLYEEAGRDKEKARALARERGYTL